MIRIFIVLGIVLIFVVLWFALQRSRWFNSLCDRLTGQRPVDVIEKLKEADKIGEITIHQAESTAVSARAIAREIRRHQRRSSK